MCRNVGTWKRATFRSTAGVAMGMVGDLARPIRNDIWVNYNDLTATEPWNYGLFEGNHPQMALIQVGELL